MVSLACKNIAKAIPVPHPMPCAVVFLCRWGLPTLQCILPEPSASPMTSASMGAEVGFAVPLTRHRASRVTLGAARAPRAMGASP
jgi:hypothetical protein